MPRLSFYHVHWQCSRWCQPEFQSVLDILSRVHPIPDALCPRTLPLMDYSNRSLCPLSSGSIQILRYTGQSAGGRRRVILRHLVSRSLLSSSPWLVAFLTKELHLLLDGICSLWVLVIAVPGVLYHLLLTSFKCTLMFLNSPFINLSIIYYLTISSVCHQNSDYYTEWRTTIMSRRLFFQLALVT